MSENHPDEPQPQPEPQSEPPVFEVQPSTFEVVEKADKSGREFRDQHPDR